MFHVNVNFPSKRSAPTKYELLRMCSGKFSADKAMNILTEQPILSKITTDCLWNFSFFEVCLYLISNFTCKHGLLNTRSGHICHILKAKMKRPVFSKLSIMNL